MSPFLVDWFWPGTEKCCVALGNCLPSLNFSFSIYAERGLGDVGWWESQQGMCYIEQAAQPLLTHPWPHQRWPGSPHVGLGPSPGSTTNPDWVPTLKAEQGADDPSCFEGLRIWGAMNLHCSPRRARGAARPWWGGAQGLGQGEALDSGQSRATAKGVRLARGPELAPRRRGGHLGFPEPWALMPGCVLNAPAEDLRKGRNFLWLIIFSKDRLSNI